MGITMQIWWSYIWRCALFSALLAVPLGAIGGITVAIIGRPDLGGSVGGILGYLGSIPVSIIMLRIILRKRFKNFSIALMNAGLKSN
jgi:hypothetical protein